MPVFVPVTLFDAIVIYLSAGAPFGVLVFLGRQNERYYRTLAGAAIAIGFWPVIAASRLGRTASRYLRLRSIPDRDDVSVPVTDVLPRSHRELLDRFTALSDLANATPNEPAELFEVAGHPNPMLATVCNARRRHSVVLRHLEEASRCIDELQSSEKSMFIEDTHHSIQLPAEHRESVQPAYGSIHA